MSHLDGGFLGLSGDASTGNVLTAFASAETVHMPACRRTLAQIIARFGGAGAAVAVPI